MAPSKSVKYDYYGYIEPNEDHYVNLIKKFHIDYIFVRNNDNFLKLINNNLAGEENLVFKVSDIEANKLKDSIIKVN